MSGPGKAIYATVLAPPIGIDGAIKRHIRRIVGADDGLSVIHMQSGFSDACRLVVLFPIAAIGRHRFPFEHFIAAGGILTNAASFDFFTGHELNLFAGYCERVHG